MENLSNKEFITKAVKFLDRLERAEGNVVVLSNDFVNELSGRLTIIAANLKEGE